MLIIISTPGSVFKLFAKSKFAFLSATSAHNSTLRAFNSHPWPRGRKTPTLCILHNEVNNDESSPIKNKMIQLVKSQVNADTNYFVYT